MLIGNLASVQKNTQYIMALVTTYDMTLFVDHALNYYDVVTYSTALF